MSVGHKVSYSVCVCVCVCVCVSVGGRPQVNKKGEGPKVSVVGGGVPDPRLAKGPCTVC